MLKYSFMTFACPGYSLDGILDAASRFGYDGVEPRAEQGHKHGIEIERTGPERTAIRKQFAEAGVAVACVATSVQFNRSSRDERKAMAEKTKAYCRLAGDIGTRRIRVFCGMPDDTTDRNTAIDRVCEGLEECIPVAEDTGVMMCLETHDFFSAGKDVASVCARIDSPWVRATWDTQHPVTAGEDLAYTESILMPYVEHVHFHDVDRTAGRNEIVPIGEGQAPIAKLLAMFRRHEYEGYISAEWFYDHGSQDDLAYYIQACRMLEASV